MVRDQKRGAESKTTADESIEDVIITIIVCEQQIIGLSIPCENFSKRTYAFRGRITFILNGGYTFATL